MLWYAVITWSYTPKSTTFQRSALTFFSLKHVEQWVAAVCFVFMFNWSSSHPVMLQPPCTLGQCMCSIAYQWPDDIPVGLCNDDFSWIWVAICRLFLGNSCLNFNFKFQHFRYLLSSPSWNYSLMKEAVSFWNLGFKFEMIGLVAWIGFITWLAQKLVLYEW